MNISEPGNDPGRKEKDMRTSEILDNISSNGGFDNFHGWTEKQIADWIRNYFECSRYVAANVAYELLH